MGPWHEGKPPTQEAHQDRPRTNERQDCVPDSYYHPPTAPVSAACVKVSKLINRIIPVTVVV